MKGAEALAVVEKIWKEEGHTGMFMGNVTKTGFCLLYEMCLGQVQLELVETVQVEKLIQQSKQLVIANKHTESTGETKSETKSETEATNVAAVATVATVAASVTENFDMHAEAAQGIQDMVGDDWSLQDLQVLVAIHNGDVNAATNALFSEDEGILRSKIVTRQAPPTTPATSSATSSATMDQQDDSTGGTGSSSATDVGADGGERKENEQHNYPQSVREIQNVFSNYTLEEILLLYRMKGNSVAATSNLLAIDGFTNKTEILKNAQKYKNEHGSGIAFSDGKEGPRRVPNSASLALVLTHALSIKTLVKEQLQDVRMNPII